MGRKIYTNIEIGGVVYPDVAAVAKAKGVAPDTVRRAIKNGTQHRIGCGRGGVEPMPIMIRGRTYKTARHAARANGVTVKAIYQALCCDRIDRVGLNVRRTSGNAKPFRIGSLEFPSMRAASLALGFENGCFVSKALRKGSKRGQQRILAAAMAYIERSAP
mgnify:CR=1 FL=1